MHFATLPCYQALVIIQEPESETSLESWKQHCFAGQAEAKGERSSQELLLFFSYINFSYRFFGCNSLDLTVLKMPLLIFHGIIDSKDIKCI